MDLAKVMDDIADQLRTIGGLRVHEQPPDMVTPTAAIVTYPDTLTFDATYGRGVDTMVLGVVVVAGRVVDRATRAELTAFCGGSGPRSVKRVLESGVDEGVYTAFDNLDVTGVEFEPYAYNGVDYMAAVFNVEVAGRGAN